MPALASEPKKMPPRRRENFDRERVEFRAESEWIEKVETEAKRIGLSLSSYIRMVVTEHMEKAVAERTARKTRP